MSTMSHDPDLNLDPTDWTACILYRQAYGMAADAIERAGASSMREGSRDGARELARLRGRVVRELGAHSGRRMEIVEMGILDAAEKRRPRW